MKPIANKLGFKRCRSHYPIMALLLCVNCTPLHPPTELPAGISISPPTSPAVYQTVRSDLNVEAQPHNATDSQRRYISVPLHLLSLFNLTLKGTICTLPTAGRNSKVCRGLIEMLLIFCDSTITPPVIGILIFKIIHDTHDSIHFQDTPASY